MKRFYILLFILSLSSIAHAQTGGDTPEQKPTALGLSVNGGADYPFESYKADQSIMPAYGIGPAFMFHDELRTYYIAALYDTRIVNDNLYADVTRTYRYLALLAQMRFGLIAVGAEFGQPLGLDVVGKGGEDQHIKSGALSPLVEFHAGLAAPVYQTALNTIDAQFTVSYRFFANDEAFGGTQWLALQLRLSYLFKL